jgi:cytidine deaminase
MTQNDIDITSILAKMAEDVDHPVQNNFRLAAAIVMRGEILAFGLNSKRTHPFQAKYAKNSFATCWHAETRAIFNATKRGDNVDFSRTTLFVVRRKRVRPRSAYVFGDAFPCAGCLRCMRDFKISRLVCSTEGGIVRSIL